MFINAFCGRGDFGLWGSGWGSLWLFSVRAGVRTVGVFVVAFFGVGEFYEPPGGQYHSCVQEGLGSGLGLLRVFASWGCEGCARFSFRVLLWVVAGVFYGNSVVTNPSDFSAAGALARLRLWRAPSHSRGLQLVRRARPCKRADGVQ